MIRTRSLITFLLLISTLGITSYALGYFLPYTYMASGFSIFTVDKSKYFDGQIHNIALLNKASNTSKTITPSKILNPATAGRTNNATSPTSTITAITPANLTTTTVPLVTAARSALANLATETRCTGGFPCQSSWNIEANGLYGRLLIGSVDDKGNFGGTLFGHLINGSWSQYSKKVTFEEISSSTQLPIATYTGYLNNMCGAPIFTSSEAGSRIINLQTNSVLTPLGQNNSVVVIPPNEMRPSQVVPLPANVLTSSTPACLVLAGSFVTSEPKQEAGWAATPVILG